jgi:hypothetical protein
LREAPSVRNVANSRVRWATVIDRVLKITNDPTNSAIAPNPRKKYRMKLIPSFVSLASASACFLASTTCSDDGTSGWTALTSAVGDVPSFALTEIAS